MAAVVEDDAQELALGVFDLDEPDLGVGMEAAIFQPPVVPAELEYDRGTDPDPARDPFRQASMALLAAPIDRRKSR